MEVSRKKKKKLRKLNTTIVIILGKFHTSMPNRFKNTLKLHFQPLLGSNFEGIPNSVWKKCLKLSQNDHYVSFDFTDLLLKKNPNTAIFWSKFDQKGLKILCNCFF